MKECQCACKSSLQTLKSNCKILLFVVRALFLSGPTQRGGPSSKGWGSRLSLLHYFTLGQETLVFSLSSNQKKRLLLKIHKLTVYLLMENA